ncbi:MAG TPA: hypothetical protein VJB92_01615 [Candidatus Paceibacterota bacterium]
MKQKYFYFKKALAVLAIVMIIFLMKAESASGAGLEFFGGFIRYRIKIPPTPLTGGRTIMLLIVKGPPDSIVILGPGLKGSCTPGQVILGYGVRASRGVLPIFGLCQANITDPLSNLRYYQPDITLP